MNWYQELLFKAMKGNEHVNNRTKVKVRALPNYLVSFDLEDKVPMPGTRRIFPHVAAVELAWTLSGEKKIEWISKYTKMWDLFAEDGEIKAAYGYRWRRGFGRDQLFTAIEALKEDPSDRQIVVMAWDNSKDGLGNRHALNVPCPIGFIINIINGKLNMLVMLRSSDIVMGLPYDILNYSFLLDSISATL